MNRQRKAITSTLEYFGNANEFIPFLLLLFAAPSRHVAGWVGGEANGAAMYLFRHGKFLTDRYQWGFFPAHPLPVETWMLEAVLEILRKNPPTHVAMSTNFDDLIEFVRFTKE